jgi:hypothetical protein
MQRQHRTHWRLGAAALGAAAFLAFAVPVADAATTSSSSNQGESLTVTAAAGTLSVSTASPTVAFPNTAKGANTGTVAVGNVSYTNSLADGSSWSVTVAGTDLLSAPQVMNGISCGSTGSTCIPFTAETFIAGQTVTPSGPTPGPPMGPALSGTDTTPGTTFSAAQTIASATSTVQGSFTQSGSTVSVAVPSGVNAAAYSGMLQYTITG